MKKIILLVVLSSMAIAANAGIMIYPKFLSFDDKTKSAEITLVNSSQFESSNYRVTLSYKKQNPDGSYTDIAAEEAPADSAIKLLRYSPRSVLLKPSQAQTIRVLKRLPEGLEPGDYVCYITFTEVLLEKAATKQNLQPGSFSVKITPIPSFSVPIFVRYKTKEYAQVTLSTAGIEERAGQASLVVQMTRTEPSVNAMVRGDLSVWDGKEMIGFIRGRYMLPSNKELTTKIPLHITKIVYPKDGSKTGQKEEKYFSAEELKGKTLTVLFTETTEDKVNKNRTVAKTQVTL